MFAVILTGWQEISNYLRLSLRTVQRWEHNGLPVKRVNKHLRSPIVADSHELDAWVLHRVELPPGAPKKLADNLQRAQELLRETQEIRKEFRAKLHILRKTVAESRAKLRRDQLKRTA